MAASHQGFSALTPKQQDRYRSLLESLEMDVEEAIGRHVSAANATGPVMISTDLHQTVLIPKFVVVKDIAMMKKFGGIPDEWLEGGEANDDHVTYPSEWDSRYNRLLDKAENHQDLVNTLSPEQRGQVRQAMNAWLLGSSSRVKSYEPMINAIHFPQTAALFAADTLCVPAGQVVIIGPNQELRAMNPQADQDPYVVTFASVCIEEGGQIQFQVPTQMNVTGTITMTAAGGCNCS